MQNNKCPNCGDPLTIEPKIAIIRCSNCNVPLSVQKKTTFVITKINEPKPKNGDYQIRS